MRTPAMLILAVVIGLGLGLVGWQREPELRDSFKPEPTELEKRIVALPFAIGKASYYDATRNNAWYTRQPQYRFYAAAGPKLRKLCGKRCDFKWGKPPYRVIVSNRANDRAIVVWVVDWCQCNAGPNEKLIDLAPEAWQALAGPETPMSRGVLKVRVEVLP